MYTRKRKLRVEGTLIGTLLHAHSTIGGRFCNVLNACRRIKKLLLCAVTLCGWRELDAIQGASQFRSRYFLSVVFSPENREHNY